MKDEEARPFDDAPGHFGERGRGAGRSRAPGARGRGHRGRRPALRLALRPRHLLRPRRLQTEEVRSAGCRSSARATGIFSFIHVEDAAAATVAALERGAPGHLQRRRRRAGADARVGAGLRRGARREAAAPRPVLARAADRRPRRRREATELRGASNAKAKRELGWQPRYPSWRQGFAEALRLQPSGVARMHGVTDLDAAKETLLAELREHSLVIGEVTLSSGATAQYYVDARRALLRPAGFLAAGELIAAAAVELGADAVGGPATAAIPPSCAALAVPGRRGTWSASSSAASARSTACSAGSRARSRPAPAAWSSRTR